MIPPILFSQEKKIFRFTRLIFILIYSLTTLSLAACRQPGPQFEIRLVEERIYPEQLLEMSAEELYPRSTPLLSLDDIEAYDWATHTLTLTPAAFQRVLELYTLPVDVFGKPFVVAAGGDPVYHGAFWTPLSSISFAGIVINQPMEPGSTQITISAGYPGPGWFRGLDPRADRRIRRTLDAAGVLIE